MEQLGMYEYEAILTDVFEKKIFPEKNRPMEYVREVDKTLTRRGTYLVRWYWKCQRYGDFPL